MKRITSFLLFFSLAALALLAGCIGGGGDDPNAVLRGTVTDSSGAPLAGVALTVGTATTNSLAGGTYSLTVTPGANLKITASMAGKVSTFDVVTAAAGQTVLVDFALLNVGSSTDLTGMSTNARTANDTRGATVTLAAGSIVIEGTNTVVDSATVEVTSAVPTDPNYTALFPGLFVGTQSNVDTPIESFGFVRIDITTPTGQKCNLAAGQTAQITIPVAVGADPGTATIPLWLLDETTGKWIHKGDATRDATGSPVVYRATVSHFSTYNLDRPIPNAIPFTITVKDAAGVNAVGASVVMTSTNSSGGGVWEGRGVTGADGTIRFPVVPPGSVSAKAALGNQVGSAFFYEEVNSEGVMTISLYTAVDKTFTIVYEDGTGEKPAANINAMVMSEGEGGHAYTSGTTSAQGVVTLSLRDGLSFYSYGASITVGGTPYSLYENSASIAGIPTKWILVESSGTPVVQQQ